MAKPARTLKNFQSARQGFSDIVGVLFAELDEQGIYECGSFTLQTIKSIDKRTRVEIVMPCTLKYIQRISHSKILVLNQCQFDRILDYEPFL